MKHTIQFIGSYSDFGRLVVPFINFTIDINTKYRRISSINKSTEFSRSRGYSSIMLGGLCYILCYTNDYYLTNFKKNRE